MGDHDQHTWNLLQVDDKSLTALLHGAWCQYLASKGNHRTMPDLHGIDYCLTSLDFTRLQLLERALLAALQSGAFVGSSEHAKYDIEKFSVCGICNQEDDRAHWLICPRFQHLQAVSNWYSDNVELPSCTIFHLLFPRKDSMGSLEDCVASDRGQGQSFSV